MRHKFSLLTNCRAGRRIGRYWACARGVTAIEFAFVAPFVIAILLAAVQIATLFIAQSYLEAVTETAMRIVLTNQPAMYTTADFKPRLCANVTALFDCNKFIIDLQPANCTGSASAISSCIANLQPKFDNTGKQTGTPVFQIGASSDNMRLLVMYQFPVISGPLGLGFASFANVSWRLLSAVQIFKREPCLSDDMNCLSKN